MAVDFDSATAKASVSRVVSQTRILFGKEFHGDGLAEREVISPIHFAHTAFAKQCDDAIAADDETSGKKAFSARSPVRRMLR